MSPRTLERCGDPTANGTPCTRAVKYVGKVLDEQPWDAVPALGSARCCKQHAERRSRATPGLIWRLVENA